MAEQTKRKKWSDVKARLEAFDRTGLVSLLGDLYDASAANRRFLHSRLANKALALAASSGQSESTQALYCVEQAIAVAPRDPNPSTTTSRRSQRVWA